MKRINLILLILLIASIASCRDDNNPVVSFDKPTPEEITIQNCHITQNAAEAFAKANNGEYPRLLTDTTPAGHTIIDFLPGREHLVNPYTGLRTEPRGTVDGGLGEITYLAIVCGGFVSAYYILTYDKETDPCPIYLLTPYTECLFDEENGTVCFGMKLQYYVEKFAENNNGEYPVDIYNDKDLRGETALYSCNCGDNTFTGLYTNPVVGTAGAPGEIGYQPVMENDIAVGFIITMFGATEMLKEFSYIPASE
jgi:hypothetical protein